MGSGTSPETPVWIVERERIGWWRGLELDGDSARLEMFFLNKNNPSGTKLHRQSYWTLLILFVFCIQRCNSESGQVCISDNEVDICTHNKMDLDSVHLCL